MRDAKVEAEGLTIVSEDEVGSVDPSDTDDTKGANPGESDGAEEAQEGEDAEEEVVVDLGLLVDVDEVDVEDLVTVIPLQEREFTCARCFLVSPEANRAPGTDVCRDCD